MHMMRPAAILRSAVRNAPIPFDPVRMNISSPSAFVRHGERFASSYASVSKFSHETARSSGQTFALHSAFRNATAGAYSSAPSRTLITAGAATACVFGPLISSRFTNGSSTFSSRRVAHCAAATSPVGLRSVPAYDEYGAQNDSMFNSKELTFGMAMGMCSGYLFKKLGKLMMLVVGLGFVWMQLLTSSGYIQVNWVLIESKFKERLDVDKDGKVTMNDAKHGFRWLMKLLTKNFQFKSAYVGGWALGFRYG
ncbi:FUN14 domain-containing protein 1 [Dissophora ornata]|nr:FUN14 domain-containing protein 1 [Dissophora ornata]